MELTPSQMTLWESAGTPVQPAYCSSPAERTRTGFSRVPALSLISFQHPSTFSLSTESLLTEAGGVKGAHVENIDTLHLAEDFETLETSRLLKIGGDSAGGGTRTVKVGRGLDLCVLKSSCQLALPQFQAVKCFSPLFCVRRCVFLPCSEQGGFHRELWASFPKLETEAQSSQSIASQSSRIYPSIDS